MKGWFKSSWLDDDGTFLTTLIILALLLLLLILVFSPRPLARSPKLILSAAPALAPVVLVPRGVPQIKYQPIPKKLFITDKPMMPPVVQTPLLPTPTPPGGGVLRKLAFTSNRADGRFYHLYMMDADGNQLERLTEGGVFDRDPHFSYDGTRIAFTSNRTGTYQIYILDLYTRAIRQITSGTIDKTNPIWSPDDARLIYTLRASQSTEIGIVNADGSKYRQLTTSAGEKHAYGFSPSGEYISFEASINGQRAICILRMSDQKMLPLLGIDDLSDCEDPVFSPIGNKLVFSCNSLEHNVRQFYIYELSWNQYYRITEDELDKDDPVFSPDGTKIAYVARWENAWNIFVMDTDGKHARNITKSYYDHMVPTWR